MKQQNEKEKEKENQRQKRKKINGEKRFYTITALACAFALVAIVVVAVAVSGSKVQNEVPNNQVQSTPNGSDTTVGEDNNDDEQVSTLPEGMLSPIQTVSVLNDYGFYHNTTVNAYYEHLGVDFSADAGTSVVAVESGVVESVYKDDVLLGTEIVINHGNGLKTVYCYVTEVEGLKAGDSVEKGEVIAQVAEPNGKEYKDGAHLHFEIQKDGASVDPASYLTLEEK